MTGGSFVLTALLSETISARRELRDIPLGLPTYSQPLASTLVHTYDTWLAVTNFWLYKHVVHTSWVSHLGTRRTSCVLASHIHQVQMSDLWRFA